MGSWRIKRPRHLCHLGSQQFGPGGGPGGILGGRQGPGHLHSRSRIWGASPAMAASLELSLVRETLRLWSLPPVGSPHRILAPASCPRHPRCLRPYQLPAFQKRPYGRSPVGGSSSSLLLHRPSPVHISVFPTPASPRPISKFLLFETPRGVSVFLTGPCMPEHKKG